MTATCTPGTRMTVSCGNECSGLATRTGDPIMRVCSGDEPCRSPGLGQNDDCPGNQNNRGSRVDFTCPASGRYTVLTSAATTGTQATCMPAAMNRP